MHQVMDAGEQQPLAAAQPADERVLQRARLGLVTGHRPGGTLDEPLALGDLAGERRPVGVGRAGDPGHDRRRVGRPAATGASAAARVSPARASQA